ncbi:hypothetical protein WIW50_00460 [Flavobacteriaceae bacterium 3-367]|uniref:hypothetical protein n=1 Tax=Eudoraea algarum TaxID=3417568 RepID=UPI003294C647
MKKIVSLLVLGVLILSSCKTEKKSEASAIEKELTILEKVAFAHGYENWKDVNEIRFTFNVDRDTTHFERSWTWKPKSNDIVAIGAQDTLSYNRGNMDSVALKTNGGFINDRYWLLAPFNLVWDKNNISYEHTTEVQAPISKQAMQKLTIVYGSEGGYTPGDAYDFYFGDDYLLKEWVFRKGNQAEASLTTTWEGYIDQKGLKLGAMHKNAEGNFKLYLSNIEVQTK